MNSDFELTANAMAAAPGRVTGLRVVPGSRHCDRLPTAEEYLDLVKPEDRQFTKEEILRMLADHRGFDITKRIVRPDEKSLPRS